MEFSGLEAQVFIGVAVILGCAFVALLCDYLKGVNERLRERTLELTVRVEESDRWSHLLQSQTAAQAAAAAVPAPAADGALMSEIARLHHEMEQMARSVASLAELKESLQPVEAPPVREFSPVRETMPETIAAMAAVHAAPAEKVAEQIMEAPPLQPSFNADPFTSQTPVADRRISPVKPIAEPTPVADSVASFISGIKLPQRDAGREIAATPFVERVSIPSGPEVEVYHDHAPAEYPTAEPTRPGAMKIRVMRNELPSLPHDSQPLTAAAPPVPIAQAEPEPVFEPVVAVEPERVFDPVAETVAAPTHASLDLALPSGMHDRATLDFLRNDPAPFTGLVVAIGINDYERLQENAGADAAQDLVRSVTQLVKSLTSNLVGPQHFACKSAEDEFIIAFNGEIGPAAQRRMSSVSERLWDFQLRSIGTFSVVFSWGATEANEESFAEAIEAAGERMRETRNNRKSMGGDRARKRVVA